MKVRCLILTANHFLHPFRKTLNSCSSSFGPTRCQNFVKIYLECFFFFFKEYNTIALAHRNFSKLIPPSYMSHLNIYKLVYFFTMNQTNYFTTASVKKWFLHVDVIFTTSPSTSRVYKNIFLCGKQTFVRLGLNFFNNHIFL